LQQSLRHLATAYKNFFDSRKGKRKGVKSGLPKFKKKTNNQFAEFAKNAFSIAGEYVYLAKIGNIKPVGSRQLPSLPSSATVIKERVPRYSISFVVDMSLNRLSLKTLGRH
jgi:putative transposase